MKEVIFVYKEKTRKKSKNIIILICCLILSLSIFFTIPVSAATDYIEYGGKQYSLDKDDYTSKLGPFTFKAAYFVYGGAFDSLADDNLLTIDTSASYWTTFTSFYNAIVPVGTILAVLWVLFDLIEKAQVDQMTGEIMVKFGIKLIVPIMLMSNGADILEGLIELANGIFNKFYSVPPASSTVAILDEIYEEILAGNVFYCIQALIELLLPFIAIIAAIIIMYVLIFGRILELGVRFIFTPIGIADAFTHGISSPGVRYLKKFFAVALQGAVIYIILLVGTVLSGPISGQFPKLKILGQVVLAFSMVGAMLKSQQLANDVAGV